MGVPRLASLASADKVKILSIDDEKLDLLLSDLEAAKCTHVSEVKRMLMRELERITDVWGRRVITL